MTVLLVEDNETLARNMARYLEAEGYTVTIAPDGQAALELAEKCDLGMVLLDLNLPKVDGLEVCRRLRDGHDHVPIIMLTARSSKQEIIEGLGAGGDDYLVKPFEMEELVARMQALERRARMRPLAVIAFNDCVIDTRARTVRCDGEQVHLAPREYALIEFLALRRGVPQTRNAIVEAVWGDRPNLEHSKTLDVHISYVRRKLGRDAIVSVPPIGYMIADEPHAAG